MYVKLVFQRFPHFPFHYLMKSVFLSLQTHVLLITTSVSCLFLYCQLLLVQAGLISLLSWMKLCRMRHDDVIKFLLALIQDHYIVPEWQSFDKNYVGHDKKSISESAVFHRIFEVRGIVFHVAWKKNFRVRLFSDLETNSFNRVKFSLCFSFNFSFNNWLFFPVLLELELSKIRKRIGNIFPVVTAWYFFLNSASASRREATAGRNKSCEGT